MTRNTRKTHSRAVHNRGDHLLESTELLADARFEIEGELELGKCRHDEFPVLSVSTASGSGNLLRCENVNSQMSASNFAVSGPLDSRPVDGIEQSLVLQPFGDRLLADGGAIQELPEPLCESGLGTPSFQDGALESSDSSGVNSNIRFIHNHRRYTTRVVDVNNLGRVPDDNSGCIVLKMTAKKQKLPMPSVKQRRPKVEPGVDGLTLGDRIKKCMDARSRAIGHKYTQNDLVADASRIVGQDPERNPVITQQALSKIIKNKTDASKGTIAFAKVFGVESMWLQYGVGPATYLDSALNVK